MIMYCMSTLQQAIYIVCMQNIFFLWDFKVWVGIILGQVSYFTGIGLCTRCQLINRILHAPDVYTTGAQNLLLCVLALHACHPQGANLMSLILYIVFACWVIYLYIMWNITVLLIHSVSEDHKCKQLSICRSMPFTFRDVT